MLIHMNGQPVYVHSTIGQGEVKLFPALVATLVDRFNLCMRLVGTLTRTISAASILPRDGFHKQVRLRIHLTVMLIHDCHKCVLAHTFMTMTLAVDLD